MKNKIRGFGIFSTLFLSIVGFGVFTYSQNIGKSLGRNSILPTIIYGFLYTIFIMMIHKTIEINNFKNFGEILENLFGKFIGRIFMCLISFCIIFLISIQLRIFIESIKLYIFPSINSEFIILITLFVCYYTVKDGEKVLTGINEILFVFLMISCILISFVGYKNLDLTNFFPIEVKSLESYFQGFLTLGGYFSGSIILFYLIPMYKPYRKRKFHISYKSIIFSSIFLSLVFLFCVGILNVNQTVKSIWPIILSFTTVDIPGGFIERVEGIIMTIAIVFFIMNFINMYFYSSYINSKSIGIEKHKISSIMFLPIIYAITLIPKGLNDINFLMNKFLFPISVFISFFIPVLLFSLSYLKFKLSGGNKR